MNKVKRLVALMAAAIFASCGTAYAIDNSYMTACKSNAELRNSIATLHGSAQVDKHIDAICGCKYTSLLREGNSAIDIQKIMDRKYGLADPQMQKFTAAEIRAGFQCLNAGAANKEGVQQEQNRTSPPAKTSEVLTIKGITLGMTKQQVFELFPQIPGNAFQDADKNSKDIILGDTFAKVTSGEIISCVNSAPRRTM